MDAQQWKQVRAAFDELVELDAPERERRLTSLGTTDPEFRAAVEALLGGDADADAWLAPIDSTLGVSPGPSDDAVGTTDVDFQVRLESALGTAYRLDRELGGGGMSRVFVAEETAFRRKVVVKALRPELAEAISAKRFQREIQVAARLQHPHIVPLLSAREVDGVLYYTMPFVQGESLRTRLRREGELPIADVVRILRDIASALAYAHRQGVVHRDIKPENVLLSEGGAVVADFGIAKALSASRAHGDGAATTTVTEQGMALGTPQYMAPEQATGDSTFDHRADLYALGVVGYEMLAGRPPFEGRTAQQLMAAHATMEPEAVVRRRPSAPTALAALVMRCLEKRPADRPQNAEEVLRALHDAAVTAPPASLPAAGAALGAPGPSHGGRRRIWSVAAACTVLGVGTGVALATWPRSSAKVRPLLFPLVFPDSAAPRGEFGRKVDLSPDGSAIAYIGSPTQSVFIRALDDPVPRRLPGTEGAYCPTFSPDGQWLAFISHQRLKKVALRGGVPVVLSDTAEWCSAWTDRNEVLFDRHGRLFRVSADGGPLSFVAGWDSAQGIGSVIPSQALPGGRATLVMLTEGMAEDWEIGVISLEDGRVTKLHEKGIAPRYGNGYVLFSRANNDVVAAPFSLRTLRLTGPVVRLPLQDWVQLGFSTAANGSLAYTSQGRRTERLVAVDLNGGERTLAGRPDTAPAPAEPRIPLDTATYFGYPRLSPDGNRVALEMMTGRFDWDVWVYDIPSRSLSRLTSNYSGVRPAGWTENGRNVVYMARDSGATAPTHVVSQPWDQSAPARELLQVPPNTNDVAVDVRRRFAVSTRFYAGPAPMRVEIWRTPLDTPQAARAIVRPGRQPRLSRDGEFLAYTSNETGTDEAYIQTLREPVSRIQISTGGGSQPQWGADARQVFYRAPGYVMRAIIAREPELRVTRRDTLFRDVFEPHNVANYDILPGGKELLMVRAYTGPVRAALVLNWPELLRRRPTVR